MWELQRIISILVMHWAPSKWGQWVYATGVAQTDNQKLAEKIHKVISEVRLVRNVVFHPTAEDSLSLEERLTKDDRTSQIFSINPEKTMSHYELSIQSFWSRITEYLEYTS